MLFCCTNAWNRPTHDEHIYLSLIMTIFVSDLHTKHRSKNGVSSSFNTGDFESLDRQHLLNGLRKHIIIILCVYIYICVIFIASYQYDKQYISNYYNLIILEHTLYVLLIYIVFYIDLLIYKFNIVIQ